MSPEVGNTRTKTYMSGVSCSLQKVCTYPVVLITNTPCRVYAQWGGVQCSLATESQKCIYLLSQYLLMLLTCQGVPLGTHEVNTVIITAFKGTVWRWLLEGRGLNSRSSRLVAVTAALLLGSSSFNT